MRSTFASLLVVASFLAAATAQTALVINTPGPTPPVTCEPTQLTFGGGTPPYFIVLVDGDDLSNIIIAFGQFSNTSFTWNVREPADENLILTIRDQTGQLQNSAKFTIGEGGSTDCLTTSSSASTGSSTRSASASSTSVSVSTTRSVSVSVSTTTTSTSTTPAPTVSSSAPVSVSSVTKPASSSAPVSFSAPVSSAPSSSAPASGAMPTGVPAAAAAAAIGAVFAALL
ncbi:hypothetical protein DFH09DRAFT_1369257 [Mycena vulgaris]|nr:hypothetical protein DFH09DRAFT_1369257 [Mycena vulgaris]